jgi:hypothetical protein
MEKQMIELEQYEEMKTFMSKVKARYTQQLCQARKRNVEWLFTFETWWKMWQDSGKWEQRGRKQGQYCMARKGDVGPYSVDNVEIITHIQNSIDANKGRPTGRKGTTMEEEYGIERAKEIKDKLRKGSTGVKQNEATRLKKSLANKKPWSEARRQAEVNRKAQQHILP